MLEWLVNHSIEIVIVFVLIAIEERLKLISGLISSLIARHDADDE